MGRIIDRFPLKINWYSAVIPPRFPDNFPFASGYAGGVTYLVGQQKVVQPVFRRIWLGLRTKTNVLPTGRKSRQAALDATDGTP